MGITNLGAHEPWLIVSLINSWVKKLKVASPNLNSSLYFGLKENSNFKDLGKFS